jgi:hemerythrin-like domain-containing protein
MNTRIPDPAPPLDSAPLESFADCHVGILRRLQALDRLPALLEPAAQARRIAADSLAFFREAIFEHHLDEERELFPAALASAQPGAERERVQAMADRLTCEHRIIEDLWKAIEKDLKRVAKGQDTELDIAEAHALVAAYTSHAAFEESEFLPLCERILGRNSNHMAALGLSLHLRHAPPVVGHI